VSLRILIAAAIASVSAPAQAERTVRVELVGGAPFAASELVAALRLRLPQAGHAVDVHVLAESDAVSVEVDGTTREVALAGRAGGDAARLVALAVVDLALDDLAVAPIEPEHSRPITVALLGSATAWSGLLAGATAELAYVRGNALGVIEVGADRYVTSDLHITEGRIRIAAGTRFGWVDVRGGLVLAPLFVSDGTGDQTLLVGAGASVRVRVPITAGVRFVVAAGVDAFATRTTYVREGMTPITTPWLAQTLSAGMEITP